ncbi:NF-kappa-B inhibitor alpha-like [Carcharodon carcharias]|uniref:NF-kappa-B inhibitor alpha-like n=1 Tax=Carcharodon carcharias TaxID=13397 RepID=UPI001B7ED552|nr:NF-kappa-B inhibitor alpha-like [Carcharodon carcharias]
MNEKEMADPSVNFRGQETDRIRRRNVKPLDTKLGLEGERLDSGIDSMQEADETLGSVTDQMRNLNVSCASVEEQKPTQSWTMFRSEDGDTFLHLAILHQRPDIASFLLWSEPSVIDVCNKSRQSPLHLSVIMRMPGVARELAQAGANLESLDTFGNTALHLACEQGDLDCVNSLLNLTGTSDFMQQRLAQDLEQRNYCGHTCLHIAAMKGDCETVEQLLSSGANINAQEPSSGRTPLHLAVEFQHREVVQLLIERGVDVNRLMYNSCTAFHLTAGRPDLVIREQLSQLTNSSLIPLYESSDSDSEAEWDARSDCEMPLDYDDLQIRGHSLH